MHKTRSKNRSGQRIRQRRGITTGITVGFTDITQVTHTNHARGQMLVTRRRPLEDTQWGDCKTTMNAYGIKYEGGAG